MTEGIIIGLITVVGGIIVAFINKLNVTDKKVDTIVQDAREAREQTANTHTTNLRDDLDRAINGIDTLKSMVEDLATTQKLQGNEVRRITKRLDAVQEEDLFIEDTLERTNVRHARAIAAVSSDNQHEIQKLRREILDIIRNEAQGLT